jgi:hypothetical protein
MRKRVAYAVLWAAAVSAVAAGVRYLTEDHDSFQIIAGAVVGCLAGFRVLARSFRREQEAAVLTPGAAPPGDSLAVVCSLMLDCELAHGFDAALGAARMLPRIKIVRVDRDRGLIVARVGLSGQSWGERIGVRVSATESAGPTRVEVESRPSWRLTLTDGGRNTANVGTICTAIRRSVPLAGIPPR